ncbi:hypothetical protein FRC07_003416 [Ceratobasidium sp. 392]|nr:hypothetical protein FRC07_003416 [Ceratobasidium sp. 392]
MALIDDLLAATEQHRQEQQQQREDSPRLDDIFPQRHVNDEDIHPDLRDQQIAVPTSRRRNRSDSLTPDERRAKHARFTELACNHNHLEGSYRRQVQDFVALSKAEQNIAIYALLQRNQSDFAQSSSKTLLVSANHKDTATPLLYCLFFAPTLKSYVTTLDHFLKDEIIKYGVNEWGLSDSVCENPQSRKNLLTGYGSLLTNVRNKAKTALCESYENGWCINRLLKKIMHEDLHVSEEHRRRWAWIAGYYKECRQSNDRSLVGHKFWSKLDDALVENEKVIADKAAEKTPQGRAQFRHNFYAAALQAHENNHPTTEALEGAIVHPHHWQIALEARIARSFSFN